MGPVERPRRQIESDAQGQGGPIRGQDAPGSILPEGPNGLALFAGAGQAVEDAISANREKKIEPDPTVPAGGAQRGERRPNGLSVVRTETMEKQDRQAGCPPPSRQGLIPMPVHPGGNSIAGT